jgi:hypothetical protein
MKENEEIFILRSSQFSRKVEPMEFIYIHVDGYIDGSLTERERERMRRNLLWRIAYMILEDEKTHNRLSTSWRP